MTHQVYTILSIIHDVGRDRPVGILLLYFSLIFYRFLLLSLEGDFSCELASCATSYLLPLLNSNVIMIIEITLGSTGEKSLLGVGRFSIFLSYPLPLNYQLLR